MLSITGNKFLLNSLTEYKGVMEFNNFSSSLGLRYIEDENNSPLNPVMYNLIDVLLENEPKGLQANIKNGNIQLSGKIRPFNEQNIDSKYFNDREQLLFTGSNWENSGRYKYRGYVFEPNITLVYRYNLTFESQLPMFGYGTPIVLPDPSSPGYSEDDIPQDSPINVQQFKTNLKQTTISNPLIERVEISKYGNDTDRYNFNFTDYGFIKIPEYGGYKHTKQEKSIFKYNNNYYLESEIKNIKSFKSILDSNHTNYEIFECNYNDTESSGLTNEFWSFIDSWYSDNPTYKDVFWERPKEIPKLNANFGSSCESYFVIEGNNLYCYVLKKQKFVFLLIRNYDIDASLFKWDYNGKYSPYPVDDLHQYFDENFFDFRDSMKNRRI